MVARPVYIASENHISGMFPSSSVAITYFEVRLISMYLL